MEGRQVNIVQALLESSVSSTITSTTTSSSSGADFYEKHKKIENFLSVIANYSDSDFKRHFRVQRNIAVDLINRYSQSYIFQTKIANRAGCRKLGPDGEVYIFLWYMANTEPYRTVANTFGVSNFSAWKAVDRVVTFVISIGHNYVKWPTNFESTREAFERISGIPNVVGAIDCAEIRIKAPLANKEDYFNRKKFYSIKLQAVVNADKHFMDVSVGEPGSLHDSRALRRSFLFHRIQQNGPFFGERNFILGDSAYPCTRWLITPYKNNGNLTRSQKRFNKLHSSTRVVVENAFGLLKSRFRRVQFFTEHRSINFVVNLITAACILHNICMSSGDNEIDEDASRQNGEDRDEADEINTPASGNTRREELFNHMQLLNLI